LLLKTQKEKTVAFDAIVEFERELTDLIQTKQKLSIRRESEEAIRVFKQFQKRQNE
jgi:hypothetical protein